MTNTELEMSPTFEALWNAICMAKVQSYPTFDGAGMTNLVMQHLAEHGWMVARIPEPEPEPEKVPSPPYYAVQSWVAGEWRDVGDYPQAESTAINHARDRCRTDGRSARVWERNEQTERVRFEASGPSHNRRVRRVRVA